MSMPAPAIAQAISAPNGPVAAPNRPGREKMPAPTIEPTTMAVKVRRENFCSVGAAAPDTGISAAVAICALPLQVLPLLGVSPNRETLNGFDLDDRRCAACSHQA